MLDRTLIDGVDIRYDYILFPFDKVPAKSKILLYGAGDIGKILYEQVRKINYCEIIAFVDLAAYGIHLSEKMPPCILPEEMERYDFDYLILAKTKGANLIAQNLRTMGVKEEKIILLSDSNVIRMEMNRFCSYIEKNENELDKLIECYENDMTENDIYKKCRNYITKEKVFIGRKDLLEWYNFQQGEKVLLVNETFGILAEFFCTIAEKVTVISKNEKHKKLNKIKNKQYNNIEFFDTLDEVTDEKYNYIVVLGELAWDWKSLEKISLLLQPSGVIFLAGENRYSLKHWAELADRNNSHCLFEGLEREKIQSWVKQHFSQYKITTYFPVLSYDCPERIYTEEYLPEFSSIRGNAFTHLDLNVLYDALAVSKVYAYIPDSFLFVIEPSIHKNNELIYMNYKRQRKPEFSILTTIKKEKNGNYVYKKTLNKTANKHILSMLDHYLTLEMVYADFQIASIKKISDDMVRFPFLEGESLDYYLWKHHEETDIVLKTIMKYSEKIRNVANEYMEEFTPSQEFIEIFGMVEYTGSAVKNGNIDAIFDNIIIQNEHWIFFDYEWVFPFSIPVNFIIYRAVEVFLRKYRRYFDYEFATELWNLLGISQKEQYIYQDMNEKLWKYFSGYDIERFEFVK